MRDLYRSRWPRAFTGLTAIALAVLVWPSSAPAENPTPAQDASDISYFKLANGLDVVVIPDHRVPVVTHMVWYRAGAADDPWGTSGIAHFLEHLMFKSTKKLKSGDFT